MSDRRRARHRGPSEAAPHVLVSGLGVVGAVVRLSILVLLMLLILRDPARYDFIPAPIWLKQLFGAAGIVVLTWGLIEAIRSWNSGIVAALDEGNLVMRTDRRGKVRIPVESVTSIVHIDETDGQFLFPRRPRSRIEITHTRKDGSGRTVTVSRQFADLSTPEGRKAGEEFVAAVRDLAGL